MGILSGIVSAVSNAAGSISRSASSAVSSAARSASSAVSSVGRSASSTTQAVAGGALGLLSGAGATALAARPSGSGSLNSSSQSGSISGLLSGLAGSATSAASAVAGAAKTSMTALAIANPVTLPVVAVSLATKAGSEFISGAVSSINSTPAGSSAINSLNSRWYTEGQQMIDEETGMPFTVNRGEWTGEDVLWVNSETTYDKDGNAIPGAYTQAISGKTAIAMSTDLDDFDRSVVLWKMYARGNISESALKSALTTLDSDKVSNARKQVTQYYGNDFGVDVLADVSSRRVATGGSSAVNYAASGSSAVNSSGGIFEGLGRAVFSPASNLIDWGVTAKNDTAAYGMAEIVTGKNQIGGAVKVAGAAGVDVALPVDLINVGNLWFSGRGDEISSEDLMWAGLDAALLAGGVLSGGTIYLGGKALKTAAKVGGKTGVKAMKTTGTTMQYASAGGQVTLGGSNAINMYQAFQEAA